MEDIKIVKKLVTKFRLAIESLTENEVCESTWFNNFPRGCCGDTCEVLSKYLLENGIHAEYVWGVYNIQTHAWLEYSGFVIDITADQFYDINDKIFITKDKQWHLKFERQHRRYSDFEKNNKFSRERLGKLYKNIKARI